MAKMRIELEMQDPARVEMFERIFSSRLVPVTWWLPKVQRHGQEVVRDFKLNLGAVSAEQRERLIDYIVKRFGDPRDQVERELDKVGFAINAHMCEVSLWLGDELVAQWNEVCTAVYKPDLLLGDIGAHRQV